MRDTYNSTNSKSLAAYYGYAPISIVKGKGVYLYDKNDNKFLDCGMALGSVSLGYSYDEVDDFVISKIRNGVNFSRPSYLEEELTNILSQDIDKPSLIARYSKSSSMLLSVIPRIARHLTKKRLIAYPRNCFLGNTEWYLSHNINSGGILPETTSTTLIFNGGDCDSLQSLFEKYAHELACIVMEPYREKIYDKKYYELLSSLCLENNVILVFDETVTGYRFHYPLAQKKINCEPNLTVIGKAFANGYALTAVVGDYSIMGEIEQESISGHIFDFSTTHAGEVVGLAAAIKTLEIYRKFNVVTTLIQKGNYLIESMRGAIRDAALDEIFSLSGQPPYFKVHCNVSGLNPILMPDIFKFFFNKGILFRGAFSLSLSHQQEDIDQIIEVFTEYCKAFDHSILHKKEA